MLNPPIKTIIRPLIPLLAILLLPLAGWGPAGHAIIAELAWRDLTPSARLEVAKLLQPDRMANVGSWADAVRNTDQYRWTAPLHYVNLPDDALAYDHDRDCPDDGCVVSAIHDFAATLADHNADPEARKEALLFLIHFVADLHQPLHAGRAADRGGNDLSVEFFGNSRRLHSIWDSGLIDAADQGQWPQWAARLHLAIDDHDRLAWTADTNLNDWTTTAGRWAYESNRLALEYSYTDADGNPVNDGDLIQDDYLDRTLPIVELRLSQGGVRLAELLNHILTDED